MEEGGIDITAGAEIPASASTGGTVQETASLESSLDTQTALGGGTTIPSAAATTTPSGGSGRVSEDTYSPGLFHTSGDARALADLRRTKGYF